MGHPEGSWRCALQCSRPKNMIWRWRACHCSGGYRSLIAASTLFTLPVSPTSLQRCARRWMCVSTGKAGIPKACDMSTLAVLWPTPGSASSSAKVRGTSPPCRSTRRPAIATRFLALVGARPTCAAGRGRSEGGRRALWAGWVLGARVGVYASSYLPDDSLDLPHVRGRHLLRGPRVPEERRRDFVDLLVGALGAHHHRTQELEEVGVRERDNGFGVELRQLAADALGAVLQVLAQVRCPRALPGSVHGPGGN
mmetsp:Transcript_25862/g.82289  ORF Transcript_25862/g.82289 Transcript_25862/m.82289 type:complete len:253 (+) Transcript_25862:1757-2515(+)